MLHKDLINQFSQLDNAISKLAPLMPTLKVLLKGGNEELVPKYLNDAINGCNVLFALMQNMIATLKKIHGDCSIRLNQLSALFSNSPKSFQTMYFKEYNSTLSELNVAKEKSQELAELLSGLAQQLNQAIKQLEKRDVSLINELTSTLRVQTSVVIANNMERIAESIDRAINLQNSLVAGFARAKAA